MTLSDLNIFRASSGSSRSRQSARSTTVSGISGAAAPLSFFESAALLDAVGGLINVINNILNKMYDIIIKKRSSYILKYICNIYTYIYIHMHTSYMYIHVCVYM